MPADSLTLYHPLSLQSLPEFSSMSSTRHMVGMTRSMSSSHASVGSLQQQQHHGHHPYSMDAYGHSGGGSSRLSYGSGGALHPSSHVGSSGGGSYLGVPMSAPASMSGSNPFLGSGGGGGQHGSSLYSSQGSNGYGSRVSPDGHSHHSSTAQARYTFPDHGHSVSPQPGSGYTTPH